MTAYDIGVNMGYVIVSEVKQILCNNHIDC